MDDCIVGQSGYGEFNGWAEEFYSIEDSAMLCGLDGDFSIVAPIQIKFSFVRCGSPLSP